MNAVNHLYKYKSELPKYFTSKDASKLLEKKKVVDSNGNFFKEISIHAELYTCNSVIPVGKSKNESGSVCFYFEDSI